MDQMLFMTAMPNL